MTISIYKKHLENIRKHAIGEFPNECCGILGGSLKDKTVEEIIIIHNRFDESEKNRFEESKHNRFAISPLDFKKADEQLRKTNQEIIGFFHSHPNHDGVPSQYDLDHALPIYSYIIISIKNKKFDHIRSWVLKNDRSKFMEEEIVTK
mgnify:CR=1 FL=1